MRLNSIRVSPTIAYENCAHMTFIDLAVFRHNTAAISRDRGVADEIHHHDHSSDL